MTRTRPSIKSAHLVMWSSPLLLLVLVFTLTSTSSPVTPQGPRPAAARRSSTPPTQVTTTTFAPARHTTTPPATTPVHDKTTSTPAKKRTKYVDVTDSTARSVALGPTATVSSGVLSGVLTPSFGVVDVPVQGPGLWTLSASSKVRAQLQCAATTVPVASRVIVWTNQRCQLQLASTNPEVSPTWQLTPAR